MRAKPPLVRISDDERALKALRLQVALLVGVATCVITTALIAAFGGSVGINAWPQRLALLAVVALPLAAFQGVHAALRIGVISPRPKRWWVEFIPTGVLAAAGVAAAMGSA